MALSTQSHSESLTTLATYLAGEFDNQAQAREEPVWYVPVRLWHRPLTLWRDRGFAFYAEQSNALKLDQPYRPRVFLISETEGQIQVEYFQINDAEAVRGGGRSPELLDALAPETLIPLPGCRLIVTYLAAEEFSARPIPNCKCQFTVDGSLREVSLGFDACLEKLRTYDKGINPETGQPIWGALMGPYQYEKLTNYRIT
ncbi:MAG: chromophore lyase CpcT/CpeT [Cyanobacteria bacterium P01_D01_bin.73]